MSKLDLKDLTTKQVIRLNEISNEIIEEFNDFSKEILNATDKSLPWLLHPVLSRNNYQSDIFINICYLLLIEEEIRENKELESIKVDSESLAGTIQKILTDNNKGAIEIEVRKDRQNLFTTLIRRVYSLLRKSIKLLTARNKKRTENLQVHKGLTLIDTFLLKNSIDKGEYIDRYYPGLLDYIPESRRAEIYWTPTIMCEFSQDDLEAIFVNSKVNILYKHDLLTAYDYIWIILHLVFINKWKASRFTFHGWDLSSLIEEEFKQKKFTNSAFEGLINYRFAKRLKEKDIDLRLIINWNENQPIDKGFVRGFRTCFPNVPIKGYQGYIISTNYNFYIQPTDYEIVEQVIPEVLCVVGKKLESRLKEFTDSIEVETAPAFRFSGVYNDFEQEKQTRRRILIALPIGLNESYDILKLLSESLEVVKNQNVEILIKPHPAVNMEKLRAQLGSDWSSEFSIVSGDFNEIVVNSDLLIGSTTSALVETLTHGIPVIVIGSRQGITQNPIPGSVDRRIWELCYTEEELGSAVNKFLNLSEEERESLVKIGREIRDDYFEPVNRHSVNRFLEFV